MKLFKGAVVCSLAVMFCSYQFMIQGAPAFMIPELVASLDLDLLQVSWVTSSFLYIYLLFQIPGGIVADHLPKRYLLCAACILMGLCCYWFSVAEGFSQAVVARGLMGVASSPGIVICLTLVGIWFPRKWFPLMCGAVESFAVAGGAIGPLLIPVLMQYSDWRGSMWWMAVFGWVLALVVLVFVKERPDSLVTVEANEPDKKQSGYSWRELFQLRDFWLSSLYGFGMFTFLGAFAGLWGVPFLNGRFPGEDILVRESLSLIYIGTAIGAQGLGMLATVIGHYRKIMSICALLVISLSALALYSDCSLSGMCCICFLTGLCCGAYMLAFTTTRNVVPAAMMGVALAATNGSMLLAGPLLQPLMGGTLSMTGAGLDELSTGDYRLAFTSLTICQLFALAAAMLMSPDVERKSC
ncbi:MAG: MFS transporter [Endozoicomonas sp.]